MGPYALLKTVVFELMCMFCFFLITVVPLHREGSVIADVESFFLASSEVTDKLVLELLTNATKESGGLLTEFESMYSSLSVFRSSCSNKIIYNW